MNLSFDDRMPKWLHSALCNGVVRRVPPDRCRGNRECTIDILCEHLVDESAIDAAMEWLDEQGVRCDCEVVYLTHPRLTARAEVFELLKGGKSCTTVRN
jgi:hypothetical protein